MASGEAIRIEGLNGINRALKEIGAPTKAISAAGYEAAKLVNVTAKSLVPRRTGALGNSIRAAKVARGAEGRAGNNTSIKYANPIHWGWFRRHIKPNPFMLKAFDSRRQEVMDTYLKQMQTLIDESVAKYAENQPGSTN